ncbi:MAG: SUMF1/EgtB/PvdO family nonheme iron enzyme, partial [Anaerolineae bacterium]
MNPSSPTQRRRAWVIPALVALVIFLGGVISDLVAADLRPLVAPYRPWVWGAFVVALLVTVVAAVRDYRRDAGSAVMGIRQAAAEYTDLRRRYLTRLVERFQYLPLRAVDFKTASADTSQQERLRMPDVYIALNTTARKEALSAKAKAKEIQGRPGAEAEPLPALEALVTQPRLALLGAPGSGKTTFVNHLAFCLASNELNPGEKWMERLADWPPKWAQLLPVPIVLREVAAWFQVTQDHRRKTGLFQAYLAYWLEEMGLGDFHDLLCEHLRDGTALLLLDGLDEVPAREDVLYRVKEMIADLPAAYPDAPIAVTCRVLSYQDERWQLDAEAWPTYELARLNEEQIDSFIRAWYNQLAAMQVVRQADILSARLSQAVRRPDLWRLANNPLLLTVMALVHTHKGELPDARALLYEDVVDLLLWRWEAIKLESADGRETTWRQLLRDADQRDIDLKRALWELAYEVHGQVQASESTEATADIAESVLLEALRALHPERSLDWADQLVQIMKLRAGLLVEGKPGVYSFPHRTFEEYLAGCHLSNLPDFTERAVALAGQGAFWREVILLAVGRLVHLSGDIDKPLMLVNELCLPTPPDGEDATGWRNVWLAGQCLLDIGLVRAGRRNLGPELIERARRHLTTLVTQERLEPRERAEAGSVLGVIGDPRPEVMTIEGMQFCHVPAGAFLMGSTDADEMAYDDEKPQHEVVIPYDYWMARYPVTNGQFAAFVETGGYKEPRYWPEAQAAGVWRDGQVQRAYWTLDEAGKLQTVEAEVGEAPLDFGEPYNLPNHPVVGVTWYEALAFARWLEEQLEVGGGSLQVWQAGRVQTLDLLSQGFRVTLPSEAEWEKAARGADGRIYPWGDEPDAERANYDATGIGTTNGVGCFPGGGSVYGVEELSGNVWEWTRSLWGEDLQEPAYKYPYDPEDGRENLEAPADVLRVLRGGSFLNLQGYVRCAYRIGFDPDGRYWDLG